MEDHLELKHMLEIIRQYREAAAVGQLVAFLRHGLGELIFLAERVDLARERNEAIDLDAWGALGQLSGDRAAVAEALGRSLNDAAA